MSWTVWGEVYDSADATGIRVNQPVIFDKNVILRSTRTWFVFTDDVVFTDIRMDIYSGDGETAANLIFSSDTRTKAEIMTDTNGVREFWNEFGDITLRKDTPYHFVPRITGYVPTADGVVAWKKTYPDPPYRKNLDLGFSSLLISPYNITFVGDEL